jgi:hypothetical protein
VRSEVSNLVKVCATFAEKRISKLVFRQYSESVLEMKFFR